MFLKGNLRLERLSGQPNISALIKSSAHGLPGQCVYTLIELVPKGPGHNQSRKRSSGKPRYLGGFARGSRGFLLKLFLEPLTGRFFQELHRESLGLVHSRMGETGPSVGTV